MHGNFTLQLGYPILVVASKGELLVIGISAISRVFLF